MIIFIKFRLYIKRMRNILGLVMVTDNARLLAISVGAIIFTNIIICPAYRNSDDMLYHGILPYMKYFADLFYGRNVLRNIFEPSSQEKLQ